MKIDEENESEMNESDMELSDNESEIEIEQNEETDCGKCIFKYNAFEAIQDSVCKYFEINIQLYTGTLKTEESKIKELISMTLESLFREDTYEYFNCLLYLKNVNENEAGNLYVNAFITENIKHYAHNKFIELQNQFPDSSFHELVFEGVSCNTPNRNALVDQFNQIQKGRIMILASCGILNEGVDTKTANYEVIVDPTQSIVQNIQRIGRITRPTEEMFPGKILIPVYIDKEEYDNVENKSDYLMQQINEEKNFSGLLGVFASIKHNIGVHHFKELIKTGKITIPQKTSEKTKKGKGKQKSYELKCKIHCPTNLEWNLEQVSDFHDNLANSILNCNLMNDVSLQKQWIQTLNDLKKYIDDKKEKPRKRDKNPRVKYLGCWLSMQVTRRKKMNTERKQLFEEFLTEYSEYFLGGEEKWIQTLNDLKKYIDDKKEKPTTRDKDPHVKHLGYWFQNQLTNYKNKKRLVYNNTKCRELFKDFLINYNYLTDDQKWIQTLNDLKKYIDDKKEKPTTRDKDPHVKHLGYWFQNQLTNYKNKERLVYNNTKCRELFKDFLINYNYLTDDQKWIKTLNDLKKYINDKKEIPRKRDKDPHVKHLGSWLSNVLNHKKVKMNTERKKLFEDFLVNYNCYFLTDYQKWIKTFNDLKKYIDDKKEIPRIRDKDPRVKQLGCWFRYQLKKYKDENMNTEHKILFGEFMYNNLANGVLNSNFMNEISFEKKWINTLNEIKVYIDENDKIPNSRDKDPRVKQLGSWFQSQLTNYNHKKYVVYNNPECKELFEDFLRNNNYLTNDQKWIKNLNDVQKYIDENDKRPSSVDKDPHTNHLGQWVSSQLRNYRNGNMNTERKKMFEEELMDDYPHIFKPTKRQRTE